MVLKKIVVSGFKSFADKTEIHFDQGVTSIIGPNGCGKSNISDAIRWVLGEHNPRRLRGQAMQDMIFNGTASRAAAGMAEVSLLFDNTNDILPVSYQEVLITRRLYRSGESEYLLNKTKCRMKDITDLFLDSGIGTNAYSLMEQGRVDMIVNAKPTERREIIEEAAGVSRFLHRKNEALRKLDRTESDISRIQDILQELQRQKRSLERQAKQAELARRYRKELLQVEYARHIRSGSELRSRLDDLENRYKGIHAQIQTKEGELRAVRERKQSLHQQLDQQDEKNRTQRDQYAGANARMEQMEQHLHNLNERLAEYAQMRERLLSECEADGRRADEEKQRIAEAEKQIQTLNEEIAGLESEALTLTQELEQVSSEFSQVEGEEKKRRQQFLESDKELTEQNNLQRTWERDKEYYTNRLQQLNSQHQEVLGEINTLQEKQQQLTQENTELKSRREDYSSQLETLNQRLQQLNQQENETRLAYQKVEKGYQQTHSRWESLCALQSRLEGFDKGVRYLLREQKQPLPDLLCTLAEKIQVETGYEDAVETALSHKLQAILCENDQAVMQAINELRHGKKGRVAFLPPIQNGNSSVPQTPPALAELPRLSEHVNCDDSIRPLVERLAGQVYVSENFEQALAIRSQLPSGYRLVTKDGGLVESDGSITGGHAAGSQILGRAREIQELEDQRRQLQSRRDELEAQAQDLRRTINTVTEERNSIRDSLHETKNRHRVLEDELQRTQKHLQQYEASHKSLMEECQGLENELEQGTAQAQEREQKLTHLKAKRQEIEQELASWAEEMQTKRAYLQSLQERQAEQRMHLVEKRKDLERWNHTIETVSRHLRELERGIEDKKTHAEQQNERRRETELAIEKTRSTLQQLRGERDQRWQEVSSGEEVSQALRSDCRKVEEEENRLVEAVDQLRTSREQIEQMRMKASVEQEYWQRKLSEEFEKIEDKEACERDERSDEELLEKVAFYKRRLGQLGVVNELAIEEHEDVKHRCDFLEEQLDDLLKSKADLIRSAKELHSTTVKLFLETFEQVKDNFNRTFRRMFNGGRGELSLLEGDPLDAGIEIEVQPPGKKLQSISLLSGGEKALVACALLFAIYEIKPCPFCFLDEIDAPLDDTNVGRFTTMLRGFLDKSQFILITHNKKTMEISDSIYGVTMAQNGLSSVYSMQFDNQRVTTLPSGQGSNGSHGANGSNGEQPHTDTANENGNTHEPESGETVASRVKEDVAV